MLNKQYRRRLATGNDSGVISNATVRFVSGGQGGAAGKHKSIRLAKTVRHRIAFFLVITLLLLFTADFLLRPNIAQALRYQGKAVATQLLAEETLKVLEPMKLTYDDLARVTRDASGKITSIETDANRLNIVKSRLEREVTASLNSRRAESMRLPLGTLLGNEYLAGRGPEITLHFQPVGSLQTSFESSFQAAGINQTSHRIVLNLTLEVTTIIPFHRAETIVSTNFLLADTIIVGEVPDYYTNITGSGDAGEAASKAPDPLDVQLRKPD